MKTAIVLFTLFFQAAADPDPTQCCTPRLYSIRFRETAEDDQSHNVPSVYLAADFDRRLMIYTNGSDEHRIIEDHQENKVYTFNGQNCVQRSMPESDRNMPTSSCLPAQAVFVRNEDLHNGKIYQVWNYTLFDAHITSTVDASNCMPFQQRIVHPPQFGPPRILKTEIHTIAHSIDQNMRTIPTNCQ